MSYAEIFGLTLGFESARVPFIPSRQAYLTILDGGIQVVQSRSLSDMKCLSATIPKEMSRDGELQEVLKKHAHMPVNEGSLPTNATILSAETTIETHLRG